jgi:uncharacterized protein YkwD
MTEINKLKRCMLLSVALAMLAAVSVSAAEPFDTDLASHFGSVDEYITAIRQSTQEMLDKLKADINAKVESIYASAISSLDGKLFNTSPVVTETVTQTTTAATTETATEATTVATTETATETTTAGVLTDSMASEILSITNEIRKSNGLSELVADSNLTAAAAYHATDMYNQSYFDHTSKDGTDFYTRIRRFTTDYSTLGENIAKGSMTAQEVMDLWMNSDGHRANILNSGYKHVGIAHCNGYFVVDFAN